MGGHGFFRMCVYLSGVTISANKAVQYQQGGPTNYADICHVECWPMPFCQMEIEKIGHGSVTNAVSGIAKRSSDDERQAGHNKAAARPQQPNNQRRCNGSREERERPRWQVITTQYPKANTPVPAEHQIKERRDAERLRRLHDIFEDPPLRCLIQKKPGQR